MNTLGLIGGMSWESSREYYRLINEGVREALGGLHSAKLILTSMDFAEIAALQHEGKWPQLAALMASEAKKLEHAGADAVMICTNLMHKLADEVEAAIDIPLLHIADAAAAKIKAVRLKKVALLGAKFTMEEGFYRERIESRFGIEVIIPAADDRALIHRVIYEELCQGKIIEASRKDYLRIIQQMQQEGAEGIILGCTEIGLLIDQSITALPVFDTTPIHAESGVRFLLGQHSAVRAA